MQVIMNGNGITINGMKVEGNCVVIRNSQMTVDGKDVYKRQTAKHLFGNRNVSFRCFYILMPKNLCYHLKAFPGIDQ